MYFLYLVNKVQQPYRVQPKTTVGNRGDNGKIEELSAQVLYNHILFNRYLSQ